MEDSLLIEIFVLMVLLIIARILYLVHKVSNGFSKFALKKRLKPTKALICIGSGGHTTEMLAIMKNIDFNRYSPRYYIMAKSDSTSLSKVTQMEKQKNELNYHMEKIPRSRHVGQSYLTSVISTLYSTLYCIPAIIKIRPDLILCNGPGICIPVCIISFLLNVIFVTNTRIVFIESFCRTSTFSLSGKMLFYIADNILVQWPSLKKKLRRSEYIGQLL